MAQARRRWQKICPLCHEHYMQPKMLDCKHSFCLSCLETVVNFWRESAGDGQLSSIPCPRCRKVFTVPENGLDDLEENEYIIEEPDSSCARRRILCLQCDEDVYTREVTSLCIDCQQLYCDFCRKIHNRITAAETHDVVEITQASLAADDTYQYISGCSSLADDRNGDDSTSQEHPKDDMKQEAHPVQTPETPIPETDPARYVRMTAPKHMQEIYSVSKAKLDPVKPDCEAENEYCEPYESYRKTAAPRKHSLPKEGRSCKEFACADQYPDNRRDRQRTTRESLGFGPDSSFVEPNPLEACFQLVWFHETKSYTGCNEQEPRFITSVHESSKPKPAFCERGTAPSACGYELGSSQYGTESGSSRSTESNTSSSSNFGIKVSEQDPDMRLSRCSGSSFAARFSGTGSESSCSGSCGSRSSSVCCSPGVSSSGERYPPGRARSLPCGSQSVSSEAYEGFYSECESGVCDGYKRDQASTRSDSRYHNQDSKTDNDESPPSLPPRPPHIGKKPTQSVPPLNTSLSSPKTKEVPPCAISAADNTYETPRSVSSSMTPSTEIDRNFQHIASSVEISRNLQYANQTREENWNTSECTFRSLEGSDNGPFPTSLSVSSQNDSSRRTVNLEGESNTSNLTSPSQISQNASRESESILGHFRGRGHATYLIPVHEVSQIPKVSQTHVVSRGTREKSHTQEVSPNHKVCQTHEVSKTHEVSPNHKTSRGADTDNTSEAPQASTDAGPASSSHYAEIHESSSLPNFRPCKPPQGALRHLQARSMPSLPRPCSERSSSADSPQTFDSPSGQDRFHIYDEPKGMGRVVYARQTVKPDTQVKFSLSKREVQSLCVVPDGSVVMVSKKIKKRGASTIRLQTFTANGRQKFVTRMDSPLVSLARYGDSEIILANMEDSKVYRKRLQSNKLTEIPHLTLSHPVLSKPALGSAVYVTGENEEGVQEIKEVKDRNTQPLLVIKPATRVDAFDVSQDHRFFAVASSPKTLTVDVYTRITGQEEGVYVSGFEGHGAEGDVCFYISPLYKREVLVVADRTAHCVTFLDHTHGCRTLGKVHVDHPARLAKDEYGKLCLACDGTKETAVIVFT